MALVCALQQYQSRKQYTKVTLNEALLYNTIKRLQFNLLLDIGIIISTPFKGSINTAIQDKKAIQNSAQYHTIF